MTTRLTVSSLALPQKISVNTTFSKPLDSAGPFFVQPGLTSKNVLATVNLKSIGDAAAAKTTLILPNASSDYTFKTASGAVTISSSTTNPTTQKITTTVIASLDLTTAANGYNTPSVQFTDLTAQFHYVAAIKKTATAPAVPAFIELTSLKLANDTGSNATDGVSFDGAINLVSRVGTTYSYSVDSGKTYQSVTGTSIDLLDKTYPAYSVKVIEKNAKGVIVNATSNANAIVVEKGAATPTITLATDTGSSLTDGITSIGTVNVTGLETGATWQYSIKGASFVNGTGTSFLLPANLTYNTGDIQVRQIDKAGNVSASSVNPISWSIDTKAETPVEMSFNDTGAIDGDNITKDGEFTVSDAEVGAKISYSLDSGKTFTLSANNSFIVPEGAYTKGQIQIKQIDAAGNTSAAGSSVVALTVDETVVVPTIALTKDDGISLTDGITNVATVTVSGLEAGAIWQYSLNGGAFVNGTGTTFTLPAGETYDSGQINVRQIDVAGNESDADGKFGSNAADWTILPSNIDVTAANTTAFDAGVADVKFFVAAGDYTYNIANFGTGDKIDFPAGNVPTVINSSNTDNAVHLQYANDGKITLLHLTGLTTAQDVAIYSVNSFNTAFGANSLTSTGSSSIPAPVVTHQAVSAAGTASASTGNIVFDFAEGTYNYSVTDFASGDGLNFPTDVAATVINSDATDKKVDVQWASNGKVVVVSVTGLTDAQDGAIYSANSFKTLFGASSLTNTGEPPVTPTGNALAVSAAGSATASAGDVKFTFAAGNYAYSISGFSNGDILDFPDDVAATVRNTSTTDNAIEVQWASGGNVVLVTLTGLASDTAYSVNSFNAAFGSGSII
jgi:hypothetical protein